MCGEHAIAASRFATTMGSSPRVRGTHHRAEGSVVLVGIIPACAGNTTSTVHIAGATRDHPRVCGEHKTIGGEVNGVTGSSPRVRGTRVRCDFRIRPNGIIPACAGNTGDVERGAFDVRDHPRVCGEHPSRILEDETSLGSSPRVRGTPEVDNVKPMYLGIIPACAGNT